jgi:hypothetical protein
MKLISIISDVFILLAEVMFAPYVSANDCAIYRFISVVFTSVSVLSFVFNIRFIVIDRRRLNPLVLSLIVNSLALVLISLPYVLFQSIKCYPVHSYFICCLQGFVCFTCGICVMYTMSFLALVQYIKLFYNSSIIYRILGHKKSFLIPLICWFIAFLWSLPPFMNIEPGFQREGQGFDCGLGWIKSDISSRIYILLAFIFIYFSPLFFISYTNLRILITIHTLIRRRCPLISKTTKTMPSDIRHRLIDIFTVAESNRLKRLRIDRRFTRATLITVTYYLLAWTPYAVCGIIQMILAMKSIDYQLPSMLLTASALTAKMSVIGQSCVYFYTVRPSNKRFSLTSATLK